MCVHEPWHAYRGLGTAFQNQFYLVGPWDQIQVIAVDTLTHNTLASPLVPTTVTLCGAGGSHLFPHLQTKL